MAGAVPTAMPSAQVGPRLLARTSRKGTAGNFSREKFEETCADGIAVGIGAAVR
jgi:hypothetical protein